MGLCLNDPDICIITEFISRGSLYTILHADPPVTFEAEHIRKLALDTCTTKNKLIFCTYLF